MMPGRALFFSLSMIFVFLWVCATEFAIADPRDFLHNSSDGSIQRPSTSDIDLFLPGDEKEPRARQRSYPGGAIERSLIRPAIREAEDSPRKETNLSYPYEVFLGKKRTRQGTQATVGLCQLTPVTALDNGFCIAYSALHCVEEALGKSSDGRVPIYTKQMGRKAYRVRVITSKKRNRPDIVALILPDCTSENYKFTPLLDTPIPRGTPLQWASHWKHGLYPAFKVANELTNPFKFTVDVATNAAGVLQGDSGGGAFVTICRQKYLVAVLSEADFAQSKLNRFGSIFAIFTHIAGLRAFNREVEEQLEKNREVEEPPSIDIDLG
jgi:hypothetical protein